MWVLWRFFIAKQEEEVQVNVRYQQDGVVGAHMPLMFVRWYEGAHSNPVPLLHSVRCEPTGRIAC